MTNDVTETPVIFRKWNGTGEIIAIFPTLPFDLQGNVTTYVEVGQHGAGDYDHMIANSKPAPSEECEGLLKILANVGYTDLRIYQKRTPEHMDSYRRELQAYR